MEGQTALPGMPAATRSPASAPARGEGTDDDGRTLAWAKLFDALLELDDYGVPMEVALSVLKGYASDWPM